jgi:hypothetical protein
MQAADRLRDRFASPAAELLAHVFDNQPLPRHYIEPRGDILANLRQVAAAAARARRRHRMNDAPPRQTLRRQPPHEAVVCSILLRHWKACSLRDFGVVAPLGAVASNATAAGVVLTLLPSNAISVLSEKYRIHLSLLFRFRLRRSMKACCSLGVWMLAGITFQSWSRLPAKTYARSFSYSNLIDVTRFRAADPSGRRRTNATVAGVALTLLPAPSNEASVLPER